MLWLLESWYHQQTWHWLLGMNGPCLPWGKCSCKFIGRTSKNTISVGNPSPVNPVSTESPSTYIHIPVYIYWYSGSQQQPLRLCKAIQEGGKSANNHYCNKGYIMEKCLPLLVHFLQGIKTSSFILWKLNMQKKIRKYYVQFYEI